MMKKKTTTTMMKMKKMMTMMVMIKKIMMKMMMIMMPAQGLVAAHSSSSAALPYPGTCPSNVALASPPSRLLRHSQLRWRWQRSPKKLLPLCAAASAPPPPLGARECLGKALAHWRTPPHSQHHPEHHPRHQRWLQPAGAQTADPRRGRRQARGRRTLRGRKMCCRCSRHAATTRPAAVRPCQRSAGRTWSPLSPRRSADVRLLPPLSGSARAPAQYRRCRQRRRGVRSAGAC